MFTSRFRQGRLSVCGSVPARKHGATDSGIRHAARNAIRRVVMDDDLTMLIGPASDGSLLEVGVLDMEGEDPVVVHAMPLRSKFYRLLR